MVTEAGNINMDVSLILMIRFDWQLVTGPSLYHLVAYLISLLINNTWLVNVMYTLCLFGSGEEWERRMEIKYFNFARAQSWGREL